MGEFCHGAASDRNLKPRPLVRWRSTGPPRRAVIPE